MKTTPSAPHRPSRGTLDDFLAPADITPIPALTDDEWNTVRQVAGRELAWRFATLRNLWVHRGRIVPDAFGFAWGGIYRTLLVGSIVATSYRNEGLFRAGERIKGTGDFFRGGFLLPRSSTEFREIVRLVNLRHRVAGVVVPHTDGGYRVIDGYEADYTYVATSFVEAIRRGLEICGLPRNSSRGRALGEEVCTILYQVAGFTGLRRMPRDLAAHERFREAYDRRLRERPASSRVQRMGREIARRIAPVTAVSADETVANHVRRHLDPETAAYLFPELPGAELEVEREEWGRRLRVRSPIEAIRARSIARESLWSRPDVAALHKAYQEATPDLTDDRLIGAILLHAIDAPDDAARPLECRVVELAAGEPLIRQGDMVGEMYVVLSATAPLLVLHRGDAALEPQQVATLAAPTVLGEIGMWRGQPAVATVLSSEANRLEILVIDAGRFELLKQEPGFRAATAAEIQRRLSLNTALTSGRLEDAAARSGDARLASIAQLLRYLTGDSHVPLDAVIGLPDDAAPVECVDALRRQVDEAIAGGGLPPDLVDYLQEVVSTIG